MTAELKRRELTNLLLATMATGTQLPVGDGIKPTESGWQGRPNATSSNFIPYTVLIPGTATRSFGSIGDPQSEWQLPYSLWAFGVQREQCEAMSDRARSALESLKGERITLGTVDYSIQQVYTESIGGTNRYEGVDPPYWGQMDSSTVWLTKEIS